MHYSKSYAALLQSLPPELRADAIEYRALKKLVKQVADELGALGLGPGVLVRLLAVDNAQGHAATDEPALTAESVLPGSEADGERGATWSTLEELKGVLGEDLELVQVLYEFEMRGDAIEPRLRLRIAPKSLSSRVTEVDDVDPATIAGPSTILTDPPVSSPPPSPTYTHELLIPLASDSAFFALLSAASLAISQRLDALSASFHASLSTLLAHVQHTALPSSARGPGRFRPHARGATPATSTASPSSLALIGRHGASDLDAWRALFALYADAQVFEGVAERDRGEHTIGDAEARLARFVARVDQEGLQRKLALVESREALRDFMRLNVFLLDVKKLQFAHAEAFRKILKKHAKRTSLPLPLVPPATTDATPLHALTAFPTASSALPRALMHALSAALVTVVPAPDEYACPICTALACVPVRLGCGHVFCVRCLVKLQKAGKDACPVCRRDCVLAADRRNVDTALLNLMHDWFPAETAEKLKQNARDVVREQAEELGMGDDTRGCIVC